MLRIKYLTLPVQCTKIGEVENSISDASDLATTAVLNTKIKKAG